jgi:hypothetical protein
LLLFSSSILGRVPAIGELFAAASIETGLRSGWDRTPRGMVLRCFEWAIGCCTEGGVTLGVLDDRGWEVPGDAPPEGGAAVVVG